MGSLQLSFKDSLTHSAKINTQMNQLKLSPFEIIKVNKWNGSELVRDDFHSLINPLSPGIKLQILLLCFHTFLTEVVGRSC